MAMMELKIGYDDVQRRTRLRRNMLAIILTIGSPLVMVALLLLLPKHEENVVPTTRLIPVLIFVASAACFYSAARLGAERMKLTTSYLLTGTELIRRRVGWPDDRIALNKIEAVIYRHRSMVVISTEQQRRFVIPERFVGFSSLAHELDKLGCVERHSQSTLRWAFFVVIVMCCWLAILLSPEKSVLEIASVLSIVFLVYSSYRILIVRKQAIKMAVKSAVWFLVGLAWAATLLLIYSKVMHSSQ